MKNSVRYGCAKIAALKKPVINDLEHDSDI